MLFDLPGFAQVPVRALIWCWVVLLPGLGLATMWLRGRKVGGAEAAVLTLGFGLLAVPLAGYAYVAIAYVPLSMEFLLAVSTAINLVSLALLIGGVRLNVEPSSRWLWAAVGAAVVVAFLTFDAGHLSYSLQEWRQSGNADCFRRGVFLFVGHHSPTFESARAPINHNWDGSIRGNAAVTSTYLLVLGESGFRFLRCTLAAMLAFAGWALGSRGGKDAAGGLLGLALFALNPYVVMIQVLDVNVMAFAFGALLMVLADRLDAGPVTLAVVAGFTVGLGMNLLPLVYLAPLSLHILLFRRRRWLDLFLFLAIVLPLSTIWLAYITEIITETWVEPFTYDFFGIRFHSNRLLAFPFTDGIARGATNPFPSFLLYPMHVVRTLGVVLVAASLIGLRAVWKESRRRAAVLVLWGVPVWAGLSLLAVIVESDQMRVILTGLAPLLLLAKEGVVHVWQNRDEWLRNLAVPVVLAAACVAVSYVDFPVDPRIRDPRWMTFMGGVENVEEPGFADQQPAYDLKGVDGSMRRLDYRIPTVLPNYRDAFESSRSRGRHSFGRWSDFTGLGLIPAPGP